MLAVRLLRLMMHGATSRASTRFAAHVTTAESRSDSDAMMCESIGGTLGSRGMSAVCMRSHRAAAGCVRRAGPLAAPGPAPPRSPRSVYFPFRTAHEGFAQPNSELHTDTQRSARSV
eukprot:600296-Prymnesium_polylepis.1